MLAKDMKLLNFGEVTREPPKPSYPPQSGPAKKVPRHYTVPEIPAFKPSPDNAGKFLRNDHSPATTSSTERQARRTHVPEELYNPGFPVMRPNAEITALTGVLLPAMKATHERRLASLRAVVGAHEVSSSSQAQEDSPNHKRIQLCNDMAKELEIAVKAFQRIEALDRKLLHLDAETKEAKRVTMGGGVDAYLEGLLEEVLVRVEAVDEDPVN